MGQSWNKLKTKQKATLISGDIIALLGLVNVVRTVMSGDYNELHLGIAFFAILIGAFVTMLGYFESVKKQAVFVWTTIIYAIFSCFIFGIAVKESSIRVFELAVFTALLALIAMNIAVFKPNDVKAFSVVNLFAVVVGAAVVTMALIEEEASHSKIYSFLGALLLGVSSITSNLAVYGVGVDK